MLQAKLVMTGTLVDPNAVYRPKVGGAISEEFAALLISAQEEYFSYVSSDETTPHLSRSMKEAVAIARKSGKEDMLDMVREMHRTVEAVNKNTSLDYYPIYAEIMNELNSDLSLSDETNGEIASILSGCEDIVLRRSQVNTNVFPSKNGHPENPTGPAIP